MSDLDALDLSALSQFRPSDLLAAGEGVSLPCPPIQVDLSMLDFDPAQPRRSFREESIEELSASIRLHGVLEPVSVRSHPAAVGRYVVNRGERRVRAARQAGLVTVPAFIDERVDPFAQAAENLHREDMSAFDLAQFISEREREGASRAEIARRLAKPRSFITEAAALIDAPDALKTAVAQGRVGADVRTLYRLVSAWREAPETLALVVASDLAVNRSSVDALLARARCDPVEAAEIRRVSARSTWPSGGRTVLVVVHEGRRGSLRIKAHDGDVGEVRFGDGSSRSVPLGELRLVCWATEEKE
ncbi:ParB/RepB/Spo0J family partition protein [Variovorax sp. J22R24]|uniref:ParB/RepB/Spo0J family partition protein n=1 Tax=Variovorax gracilis TaxID=3053502 RepID=UPI0025791B02|nr:ParB/RepB/Spo0J family partition protein [Variovorax sp. J22R24]MDM0108035.1 ParB/RepB/Spo0J family partition protein [Variovorax sp. J22R24]